MTTYIFTQDSLDFFSECKRLGMNYTEACRSFRWSRHTVRKYAALYGFGDELRGLYPPSQAASFPGHAKGAFTGPTPIGMRWLKPEDIDAPLNVDTRLPHVRAAMMPWRAAA